MKERATSDKLRFLERESKKDEGRKSNMRYIKILKKKMKKKTKIQGSADALGNWRESVEILPELGSVAEQSKALDLGSSL